MSVQRVALVRTLVGLLQGVILYRLYLAFAERLWPATDGLVFAPLVLAAFLVPLVFIAGIGNLKLRTLALWTAGALLLSLALGYYDLWREPFEQYSPRPRLTPSPWIWVVLPAILFILHALVAAGDGDRKYLASYLSYFEQSWKQGVQLLLTILFVGVLWLLLWLGASLFGLIRISFFAQLLWKPWFSIPVTALATACAVHITDVRTALISGARTVKLTLLSWLLPVIAFFVVLFLLALFTTGLEPLWSTRRAGTILLSTAAALVFLINAAYHDGLPETHVPLLLRQTRFIAALTILPVVALAAYALWLRIGQYGLTPPRVFASAATIIMAFYAMGYAYAAMRARLSLKPLEVTNVVTAYAIVATAVALFSPIADPWKIAANNQVHRLATGVIPPEKFDFTFLRFDAGRYGREALAQLASKTQGPQAEAIMERAKKALAAKSRYQTTPQAVTPPPTPAAKEANITLLAAGTKTLPKDFLEQTWEKHPRQYQIPRCLYADTKCEAILIDADGDGTEEIVVWQVPRGFAAVFGKEDNQWIFLGQLENSGCPGVRESLREGQFRYAAPRYRELTVGENRMRIVTQRSCAPQVKREQKKE